MPPPPPPPAPTRTRADEIKVTNRQGRRTKRGAELQGGAVMGCWCREGGGVFRKKIQSCHTPNGDSVGQAEKAGGESKKKKKKRGEEEETTNKKKASLGAATQSE